MYGLIILLNRQHRNLTFLIELRRASFYDEQQQKNSRHQLVQLLLRKPYQCFDASEQLLQYRDRSRRQKQVTSVFSYCICIWKEMFLLNKGSWVQSPSGCQGVEGICVAVSGAVLTVPPIWWAAVCSFWCTYIPMLVSPRSLGSPSVSAVISLTKPCVQIPGARPCWSLPMRASC